MYLFGHLAERSSITNMNLSNLITWDLFRHGKWIMSSKDEWMLFDQLRQSKQLNESSCGYSEQKGRTVACIPNRTVFELLPSFKQSKVRWAHVDCPLHHVCAFVLCSPGRSCDGKWKSWKLRAQSVAQMFDIVLLGLVIHITVPQVVLLGGGGGDFFLSTVSLCFNVSA